ncbi:MAG: carbohydrate kinase [Snowella sp.]|nr:carbohydrate kinase [Snowella sp.]
MGNPQVLCLGEILFDCLADQLGQPLDKVMSWTRYPGGAPANVACGLVKLDIPSAFIGCIGSDSIGEELVNVLQDVGVNTWGVQRHPSLATRQVYVIRSLDGDRHFAGFGSTPTVDFADTQLTADHLPEEVFKQAQYLVLGTITLAYPQSRQAVYRAVEWAKKYHLKIFLDINWRSVFWEQPEGAIALINDLLNTASFLKCTDEEAEQFFQTQNTAAIQQRFRNLQGILITAGERGCHYQLGNNQGFIPAFPVQVIDTTGAGDSFVAGFLKQLVEQNDQLFEDRSLAQAAIRYASAAGALTTTKLGAIAAQPTDTDIQAFLSDFRLTEFSPKGKQSEGN